jgi:hypothetical protein
MADDAAQKPDRAAMSSLAAMITAKPMPGSTQNCSGGSYHDIFRLVSPVVRSFSIILLLFKRKGWQAVRGGSPHAWPACTDLA